MPQVTIQLTENEYKWLVKYCTEWRLKPEEVLWVATDCWMASLEDNQNQQSTIVKIVSHFDEKEAGQWETAIKEEQLMPPANFNLRFKRRN